jgi:hypothetical protein
MERAIPPLALAPGAVSAQNLAINKTEGVAFLSMDRVMNPCDYPPPRKPTEK